MTMYRKSILALFVLLPLYGFSQSISLEESLQMAHDNYPAIKQYDMVNRLRDFNVDNAAKAWLPKVSAQVGVNAFTDIIDASPQMKQIGVDQNNFVASAMVTVSKMVYDGGQTAAGQEVVKAQAEVQKRQLDVTIRDINERVEQIFFGILTLDEQLRQNEILQKDLEVSSNTVKSLIKNGLANPSDLDAVSVEQAKAEQQACVLGASRKTYLRMLGVLIGKTLDENVQVKKPEMTLPAAKDTWGVQRPELSLYASKSRLLSTQRNQLDTRLKPTVSAMGIGMLHSKVSEMVHNATLLAGISVSWNIGALYTRKNDIHKLEVEQEQIDNQREVFLFNNRLQNEDAEGNIHLLHSQLDQDAKIVTLQESIKLTNEKKVKLGTETVNELMRSVNAVSMARQQQSLHELQLLQAIYHSIIINQ